MVKIVSLFDGMACGMLAMLKAGQEVDKYYAYEIDKYAIQTATHNFPQIIECGDVFKADFSEYKDIDFVVGGSPCTYWSIAQKNNRETEASGLGWELFSQYVRAIREIKPKFFIYENNKSMSNAIRESITEAFGFEPICINSALVSAQNRQRLYWVGKLNENGTYDKVDVEQPEDKGILLKDILDGGGGMDLTSNDKAWTLTASYDGAVAWNTIERSQRNMCVEPVGGGIPVNTTTDEKSHTLKAQYFKNGTANFVTNGGFPASAVAENVCVQEQVYRRKAQEDGTYDRRYEARTDGKTGTLTGTMRQNALAQPVQVGALPRPNGELSSSQGFRIYDVDGKSVTLKGNAGGAGGKTGLYAIPTEFEDGVPVKAISQSNGKTYPVYTVADGKITIKGKEYPIKLNDGYYIIRKLSVGECKRLQTVPEWYEFPVSNAQAYKMLGNGWTVDVIAHLIKACLKGQNND